MKGCCGGDAGIKCRKDEIETKKGPSNSIVIDKEGRFVVNLLEGAGRFLEKDFRRGVA